MRRKTERRGKRMRRNVKQQEKNIVSGVVFRKVNRRFGRTYRLHSIDGGICRKDKKKTNPRGFSPRANYTDRAATACRRS
jgi:hypothetical protein